MGYKTKLLFLLLVTASFSVFGHHIVDPKLQIIPVPRRVIFEKGVFRLDGNTRVVPENLSLRKEGDLLTALIHENLNLPLSGNLTWRPGNNIRLVLDTTINIGSNEGYILSIGLQECVLRAKSPVGIFYGIQTLGQLVTDRNFWNEEQKCQLLPAMRIEDEPEFVYRGALLDVARHFYPVEFVRKFIDLMSEYKLNTLHWHLTDAEGWRLEMKKYPELTKIAAWRLEEGWLKWRKEGKRYSREGDANAYGGYYTQEEVMSLVAYAADRFVTIIPEIEMPGHSDEVLAVYPELSCSGKPYTQGAFCVGNEKSFEFIENVLEEVMMLFPSSYIHIGGDEVSKKAWAACPKCQTRMQKEKLKNTKELQSYMIHRVERFLNSKGREIIGWDEILDGGLAPAATVMSWRGEKGGIEAARMGHNVIMTPEAYCYFDSYQADPKTQPFANGGFIPYLKIYSYYPVPGSLNEKEARFVLGAQANIWTEYISTSDQVEYMAFPRLLALSEVVWSPLENKNVEDFKYRVGQHIGLLQKKGVNVFTLSDRIELKLEPDIPGKKMKVWLESEKYGPEVRYTIDGTEPDTLSPLYARPFYVSDSAIVKAAIFTGKQRSETILSERVDNHKAIGKKVVYKTLYHNSYPAAGRKTLTDGLKGDLTYRDGHWQGFLKNIDITVDLGQVQDLSFISLRFLQLKGPGVYMPQWVRVKVSEDGVNFMEVGMVLNDIPTDDLSLFIKDFTALFTAKARYVNIFAKKYSGFMFTDEVVIY